MDRLRPNTRNRHRVIEGRPIIELTLKTPHQLFDERDPAPFRERDLDDDAARYIISSYQDLPTQEGAKLSLYFSKFGEFEDSPHTIKQAIHMYFQYEAESKRRQLRTVFKQGLISLAIGLTFLGAVTYFSHGLRETELSGFWNSFMREGLLLMGWVAMWHPINTFLYEWWPIFSSEKVLHGLSVIEIDIGLAERAHEDALASLRESVAKDASVRSPTASISRARPALPSPLKTSWR